MSAEPLIKKDLICEIEITSIDELYKKTLYSSDLNGYIFRGHSKESYKLIPILLRDNLKDKYNNQAELCLDELKRFILFFREANDHGLYVPNLPFFFNYYLSDEFELEDILNNDIYYWLNDEIAELGILAQHYGVHTRFLDWTRDIKVALYFACKDNKTTDEEYCNIWAIDAQWLQDFKREQRKLPEGLSIVISSDCPDNHEEKRRLIEMVQDDSIPIRFFSSIYANNPNLSAQKGILSLWQYNMVKNNNSIIPDDLLKLRDIMSNSLQNFLSREIDDDIKSLDILLLEYFNQNEHMIESYKKQRNGKPIFYNFKISKSLKNNFLNVLKNEGYDKARIFPGYDSVASMVNDYFD